MTETQPPKPELKPALAAPGRGWRWSGRLLRRILTTLLTLLLFMAAFIWYVLATESGTGLWIRAVSGFLPGLQIEQVEGKVLGNLRLSGVKLQQNDIELQWQQLDLDCQPSWWQVYCRLALTGLDSKLKPSPPTEFAWPELSLPDVRFLPMPVVLELKFQHNQWQQQALPELDAKLQLFEGEAELQKLRLLDNSLGLDLELRGRLSPNGDYRMDLAGQATFQSLPWAWKLTGPLHDFRLEFSSVQDPERGPKLWLTMTDLLKSSPKAKGNLSWQQLPPVWLPPELQQLTGNLDLTLDGDTLGWQYQGQMQLDAAPAAVTADLALDGELRLPLAAELAAEIRAKAKGQWSMATADSAAKTQDWSLDLLASADARQLQLTRLQATLPNTELNAEGLVWPELKLKAQWKAANLAALWPGLAGHSQGRLQLDGPYAGPALQADLGLRDFRWQQQLRLKQLSLKASAELATDAPLSMQLRLAELQAAGLDIRQIDAELDGRTSAHRLSLAVNADAERKLSLNLTGGWQAAKQQWQGLLTSVRGQWPGQGQFEQPQPSAVLLSASQAELADWCLHSDNEKLCLKGQWQHKRGWQAGLRTEALSLRRVNPWLPAGVPPIAGRLTSQLEAQGLDLPQQLKAKLQIVSDARPAELAVAADLDLDWQPSKLTFAPSWLELAGNKLSVEGQWSSKPALKGRLQAPRLDRLKFDVQGELQADWQLTGTEQNPRLISQIQAERLYWQDWGVKRATLSTDLAQTGRWQLQFDSRELKVPGQQFPSVSLALTGSDSQHRLQAAIEAPPRLGKAELQLSGGFQASRQQWNGLLDSLRLAGAWGDWHSVQPTPLLLSPSQQKLSNLCLQQQQQQLCVAANQAKQQLNANLSLQQFPLSWFKLVAPELVLTGELSGQGSIRAGLSPFSLNQAQLDLSLGPASLAIPDSFGDSPLLSLKQTELDAQLRNGRWLLDLQMALANPQFVKAKAELSGLSQGLPHEGSRIDAQLGWLLEDWSALSLVVPEIQSAQGKLTGDLQLSGRLADPKVVGQIELKQGRFVIPELGTETQAELLAKTADGQQLQIQGQFAAGDKGKLSLDGQLGLSSDWPLDLRLKGSDYLLLDRPEIRLFADPDIRIQHQPSPNALQLTGEVALGPSLIWLEELPASKVETSSDVLVVDRQVESQAGGSLPILMDLALKLKAPFEFNGQGLSGQIKGGLTLKQTPGKSLRALGEMRIDQGKYDAYGQKLNLTKARLAFNGPVDNPALDLEASKTVESVKVGIQGKGTAKNPQITLFSEPPMDESEILSWLILGRPLDKASSDDGNQLANAALALGVKGAGAITAQIASQLGLEKVNLEMAGTGSKKELRLTAGLTKKLSLSYGQGIEADTETGQRPGGVFRLRYQLTPSLAVELIGGAITGLELAFEREFESFSGPSAPPQKVQRQLQQTETPEGASAKPAVTPSATQLAPGTSGQ